MSQNPAEQNNEQHIFPSWLEDGAIHKEVAEQKEDQICDYTDNEWEDKINKPIVLHFHPVHPHHLDQFLFFLKYHQVKKYGKKQA